MRTNSDSQSFLPLTEATFFILLSLFSGPKHGYAIMKEVAQISDGRITFSTGTLYGALKRLLNQGWIARNGEDKDNSDKSDRNRKDYILTALGKEILTSEIARMRNLVQLSVSIDPKEV